jgi:hypothetical protein
MLWTKSSFYFELDRWLHKHGVGARLPQHERRNVHNRDRAHMHNDDVSSMPEKSEYRWCVACGWTASAGVQVLAR